MNVKQYLDHCSEQNWPVVEQDKRTLPANKNIGANEKNLGAITSETPFLEARVQSLKQAIAVLKSELIEEKALWKKEVEQMARFLPCNDRNRESDLNSEAEVEVKSDAGVPNSSSEPLVPFPLIRDFEEKLSRYQGALAQAHAEKRLNIRRQIAANTYRKRLNEVEKLCQEELNKVRETATYLEPLKQIASEWNKPRPQYTESIKSPTTEKIRKSLSSNVECGGDFSPCRERGALIQDESNYPYEVPVKQIDASLVMDEDASSEIKGKIVLQIGSLPSEVPTICYSAKFE